MANYIHLDKTFIYSYNGYGNVSNIKEYAYTTETTPTGTYTTKSCTYTSTYPDRLDTFNGSSITYNTMGCPTSFGGKNYSWDKGKLTRVFTSNQYINGTFTYDGYGKRINKYYRDTSSGYTYNTQYTYDGQGRLIREYCTETRSSGTTTHELIYLYDDTGIIGVSYSLNGATPTRYYYRKNLQGDVLAIYTANGTLQAEYAYDAYGNCTITNSTNSNLANYNPIRYRGYYYDRETGLYYLNSRYYNPQWRRFISPDDTASLNLQNINGLNLYAYANNNPISIVYNTSSIGGMVSSSIVGDSSIAAIKLNNPSLHWGMQTVVGALPDLYLGLKYIMAKGMHTKFAYATNTRYINPIMGGTSRWFAKADSNFGSLAAGNFKQILTGDARAGLGSLAKSFGKTVGVNAFVNFAFNLYENDWKVDSEMLQDTAIDTAIGVGSYYMAAGTMALVSAGVVAAGFAMPGIIVVGGIIILSIGFEHLIREITGYWE